MAEYRLIHGDCLAMLDDLTGIDAIITDPPYGIQYQSRHTCSNSRRAAWWDKSIASDEDVSARDAVVAWAESRGIPWVVFGTWKQSPPSGVRGVLVWNKGPASGMGDLSFPWKLSWEMIFVGGQGWSGRRDEGVIYESVTSSESTGRTHPTEKPVGLLVRLIQKLPDASVILDPFMGTGSTGLAALACGKDFVGIEIDDGYMSIASRRLAAAHDEPPLFAHRQRSLFVATESHVHK